MQFEAEVRDRLSKIVSAETGCPGLVLGRETCAVDVGGWDSMAHARIVLAAEEAFGVSLDMESAFSAKNVGELVDLILHESR